MNTLSIMLDEIEAYKQFISGSDSDFNEDFISDLPSNASVTLSALEAGYAAMKELERLKDGLGMKKAS